MSEQTQAGTAGSRGQLPALCGTGSRRSNCGDTGELIFLVLPDQEVTPRRLPAQDGALHNVTVMENDLWTRFVGHPLASVSERFPLAWPGIAEPGEGGEPSAPGIRPFGLRILRVMGSPRLPSYRYSHARQLTTGDDGRELPGIVDKLDWTTVTHCDGDEGPAKDYAWETVPDDDDPE